MGGLINDVDKKSNDVSEYLTKSFIHKLDLIKDIAKIDITEGSNGVITYLDYVTLPNEECEKDSESIQTVIGLKVFTKFFETSSFDCKSSASAEQLKDLHDFGIHDAECIIDEAVITEHANKLIHDVFEKIKSLSNDNMFDIKDTTLDYFKKLWFKWFKKEPYVKYFKIDNERKIVSKILGAGNLIAIKDRRGPAQAILCSRGMLSILSDIPMFIFSSGPNTVQNNAYEFAGNIAGMSVIIDNSMKWNDLTTYVFRGTKDAEHGIYVPIYGKGAQLISYIDESTMKPMRSIRMKYGIIEVGNSKNRIAKLNFKLDKKLAKMYGFGLTKKQIDLDIPMSF
jgi:hypothetical protein